MPVKAADLGDRVVVTAWRIYVAGVADYVAKESTFEHNVGLSMQEYQRRAEQHGIRVLLGSLHKLGVLSDQ